MKASLKILLILIITIIGLTALGMAAAALAERSPSRIDKIGGGFDPPPSFMPYDGRQLAY
ncbi:hypothetical protein [Methylocapsa aurea]|jgi:hypothetical protein|uniref:hypothetical protein n=1 Tax=Methylocapsa aurea TaxID=663610 RepID=UPI00056B42AF|nr:hypothetical protein [Methylocapsa aurea]